MTFPVANAMRRPTSPAALGDGRDSKELALPLKKHDKFLDRSVGHRSGCRSDSSIRHASLRTCRSRRHTHLRLTPHQPKHSAQSAIKFRVVWNGTSISSLRLVAHDARRGRSTNRGKIRLPRPSRHCVRRRWNAERVVATPFDRWVGIFDIHLPNVAFIHFIVRMTDNLIDDNCGDFVCSR